MFESWNHYNMIALSLLSNKIWELVTMLLFCIWSAFLWENITYTTNVDDTTELFRLLKKIKETYCFCSETRVHYESTLIPCGYIVGKNYFVHIQTNLNDMKSINHSNYSNPNQIQINIIIYGWFSIRSLITKDIINDKQGKYNLITPGVMSSYLLVKEDYPEEHFHKNASIAAKYIYESVKENYNKSGVYLLYGTPGTGKTTTSKKIFEHCEESSYICPDISTSLGGGYGSNTLINNLLYYYNVIKPGNNKYLICILDEVDETIDSIFKNETNKDKNENYNPRYTKKNWNQFLEKIYTMKNVILLLTTNKTKEYFDSLDPSLFRRYRITKSFKFDEESVVEDVFNSTFSTFSTFKKGSNEVRAKKLC